METTDMTLKQRRLLQRWHDGETSDDEAEKAEELVASSDDAEAYVDGLDRLGEWVRSAFDEVEAAYDRDSDEVAEAALEAPPLEECELATLAPMLERYHDGEVGRVEKMAVERLVDERDDVAEYLDRLDRLGRYSAAADTEARRRVDFDRFVDRVDRDVAFEDGELPGFDEERDAELLHRFADGELPEEREAEVKAWIDAHPDATERVDAIRELGDAAEKSFDSQTSDVDWDGFHAELDDRLDALETDDEDGGADVVSLGAHAEDEAQETADDERDDRGWGSWLTRTTNGTIAAAAAAALLVAAGAAVGQFVLGDRVVEKKVVIVDDVKHDDDSSVRVEGPMKQVKQESSEDDSTIIWLKESNGSQGSQKGAEGSTGVEDGSGDDHEPAANPDAGNGDTDGDQPI